MSVFMDIFARSYICTKLSLENIKKIYTSYPSTANKTKQTLKFKGNGTKTNEFHLKTSTDSKKACSFGSNTHKFHNSYEIHGGIYSHASISLESMKIRHLPTFFQQ